MPWGFLSDKIADSRFLFSSVLNDVILNLNSNWANLALCAPGPSRFLQMALLVVTANNCSTRPV